MGKKPVLMLAGSVLAAVALAGCQSARNNWQSDRTGGAAPSTAQAQNWNNSTTGLANRGTTGTSPYAGAGGGANVNGGLVSQNAQAAPASSSWDTNSNTPATTGSGAYGSAGRLPMAGDSHPISPPDPRGMGTTPTTGGRESNFGAGDRDRARNMVEPAGLRKDAMGGDPISSPKMVPETKPLTGSHMDSDFGKPPEKTGQGMGPAPFDPKPSEYNPPTPHGSAGTSTPGMPTTRTQDNVSLPEPKSPENEIVPIK
jgi:hypothetical protein